MIWPSEVHRSSQREQRTEGTDVDGDVPISSRKRRRDGCEPQGLVRVA